MKKVRVWARSAVYAVEAAGLLVLMLLFASLPVDWASGLGGWIGRTVGARVAISRRALKNMRRAMPDKSDAENQIILRGMWDNLGRSMAEYPHLDWICSPRSGRVAIVNGEGVVAMLNDGKPGIVFGGHLGNWEVGPAMLHRLMGASLLSVYRPANNPWVDALLLRSRGSRLAVAKGAEGGRDVLLHMRRGGHIGLLVDQKQNDGVAVPFLGHIAMTAPGVARLSRHFDCPAVPVRLERLGGAHFRFTVTPPLAIVDTGDRDADDIETMTQANDVIGAWVLARPEQWLWLHRRWPS
jgi:KDO2-lipid IV(A) lauroyltransferase